MSLALRCAAYVTLRCVVLLYAVAVSVAAAAPFYCRPSVPLPLALSANNAFTVRDRDNVADRERRDGDMLRQAAVVAVVAAVQFVMCRIVVAVDFYINFCHIATYDGRVVRHMSTTTMHSDSPMTFSTFS